MKSHSNKLINETSPYLQQHAHNPVQWYPWNAESQALAKKESKPILLSIGYSACHWCHVMAHESFENEAIAEIMNTHFINIKVDREERPDLDKIYQTSHQLLQQLSDFYHNNQEKVSASKQALQQALKDYEKPHMNGQDEISAEPFF